MLIIHPTDPTTDFLRVLYEDMEDVRVIHGQHESRNELLSLLFHRPGEPILLLGHGSDAGLFRLENGENRCYVGRSMAYCLRRHPVIGIWCHAHLFAERFRLHGLFSGMIISEMEEAHAYGFQTTEAELAQENLRFASTLSGFLRAGLPFREIPDRMKAAAGDGPAVRLFNYQSLFAL